MVHLLGTYLKDILFVNQEPFIIENAVFALYSRILTVGPLGDYFPATELNQSTVDSDYYDNPKIMVFNDQWQNIEDIPRLT